MVHVIMGCFKRQLWFQNSILVSGRCSVKLVLGTGGVIPCHDRCKTFVFFFFKDNFFFSKMKFLLKKKRFQRPFYPSTPGLKLCCH